MATPNGKSSTRRQPRPQKVDRKLKRKREVESIEALQKAVDELDPKTIPEQFTELPLSKPTAAGLRDSHFVSLTDIQARAIPTALRGPDILGAAKTGSGKTLAFIVPVLEKLYRARWTELDGLGALIVSPTRELSAQIFEELRKVGRHHGFSAGLVIGGKSLQEEAERVGRMNILVCTPGRMLQHLDQTATMDVNNLQILVLDEADRILDMGFKAAVDALVEHLPQSRQTLLFSATQTRKVSDLARLSLQSPEYIAVHEAAAAATPSQLQQHYVVTPLPEKLDTLYGFIRSNLKSKMIVFFSSGKQVRFAYEAFRQMQPGISLLHLHGRQKQVARLEILRRFAAAKHACLFATDVVARGVDIPMVDWVVQVDCPEDADTYIHRSGRTARYESAGKAILFLDPSEEAGMIKRLEQKKVPIKKVNVRETKKQNIQDQLQNMCFQQYDVKYLAQKAFISYTRSVHLQKDKDVFKLDELDLDGFAKSLGLAGAPQIKFRKGDKGEDVKTIKNRSRAMLSSGSEDEDASDGEGGLKTRDKSKDKKKNEVRTKAQRMFERTNQDVLTKHYQNLIGEEGNEAPGTTDNADEADFFAAKRVMDDDALTQAAGLRGPKGSQSAAADPSNFTTAKVLHLGGERDLVIDSKRREKLLKSKKQLLKFQGTGTKMVFDDDGNAQPLYQLRDEAHFREQGAPEAQRQQFVQAEADRVRTADVEDKALAKAKRREKKLKRKARERGEAAESDGEADGDRGEDEDDMDGGAYIGGSGQFGDDGDDGLALLRSLPMAGENGDGSAYDNGYGSEGDAPAPAKKKQKKWFQNDSDVDSDGQQRTTKKAKTSKKDKHKVFEMDAMPDNLEDLEALATGLLDD
ncbi:ATP-dependent RNA helicase DDX10/DBP4 [Sporothrix schenckii 1099-18]|uniref:ATP-dependent RNA helicase n=1 Tax=Sporothrix schenckii 1099-18 TaxID=1397361 RepID=A0A0F2M6B2_SPOSC|nr:ATP-dependent RNA helicase DDX10/DBP4 [Sporothrix schenckii 1099-18]KJR84340.1 ATP-dependent RNA helicase DDX10/DBP4 [Sporothrix schenckii 1099-18]